MTPEGKVKIWMVNQFRRRFGDGIWTYAPPGGMFGQAGQADRFFLVHGVFVVIEAKDDGKKLTPLQLKRLRDAHDLGAVAASMIGKDYAKLEMIFAAIDLKVHIYKLGQQAYDEQKKQKEAANGV